MAPTNLTPLPDKLPLLVFSSAEQPPAIKALRQTKVEALMVTFERIRGNPDRFHEKVYPLYDWPVRKYLDSGIFTLMRKAGVSRSKIASGKVGVADKRAAFISLAKDYATYLKKYGWAWDHCAELDVDQVLTPEYTKKIRPLLYDLIGPKLLPVWHLSSNLEDWDNLLDQYPYVSIGGDAGLVSVSKAQAELLYRKMLNMAHAKEKLVHRMGETRTDALRNTPWDTADSTTWFSAQRFGRFNGIRYSSKGVGTSPAKDLSLHRSLEDFFRSHQLDPVEAARPGQNSTKLMANIYLLQERQELLRKERNNASTRLSISS